MNAACPQCGSPVDCGMRAGRPTCWCFSLPHAIPVPESGDSSCFCEKCLRERLAAARAPAQPLIPDPPVLP